MKKNNIRFLVVMVILAFAISSLSLVACSDVSELIGEDTSYNEGTPYNEDTTEDATNDATNEDTSYTELFWDANTEDNLAGYKIYYGVESMNYVSVTDVGNVTTYFIEDMGLEKETVYYMAITAYDTYGNESDFSGEISFEY